MQLNNKYKMSEQVNVDVPFTSEDSVVLTLSQIASQVDKQVSMWRQISKDLKKTEKEIAREQKRLKTQPKTKRTVVQKPIKVNALMRDFLKAQKVPYEGEVDDAFTRQVMMKAVSAYIKDQKLQQDDDKKKWKPDGTLSKLFGLKKTEEKTFMNINGLISRVVLK